jgi:hypothetical protein
MILRTLIKKKLLNKLVLPSLTHISDDEHGIN